MRKNLYKLFLIFIISFSGCSVKEYTLFGDDEKKFHQKEPTSQKEIQNSIRFENKIAPKDKLEIEVYNVYNQKDFGLAKNSSSDNANTLLNSQGGFLVSSSGEVFLPILGRVKLGGLTVAKASEKLTTEYKKYLRHPFVNVSILNQRIYVLGEVNKPGMISVLNETMTIFEAIARSGDFTDYGIRDDVKIISGSYEKTIIKSINMTDVHSLTTTNIILKPNDIVYVKPRKMKGFNIGVKEALPLLQVITNALAPFVSVKYLTE